MKKVYVKSVSRISAAHPDPDYRSLFTVIEARRMSLMMKRAVATSTEALREAGVSCPDGIITGTGLGSIGDSESFLKSLYERDGTTVRPTYFMQSTHNTIGSLIAIRLQCHGYNATYSQNAVSFESAVMDAFLQIGLGALDNVLVGAFEEMPPSLCSVLEQYGYNLKIDGRISETAMSMVLSSDSTGALCELAQVSIGKKPIPEAELTINRPDCISIYGENLSVSALGAADAVDKFRDGAVRSVLLTNDFNDTERSYLLFQRLCGD